MAASMWAGQPDFSPPAPGDWDAVSPAEAGWDPLGLEELARYCQSEGTNQLLVAYRGRILLERYWLGAGANDTTELASLQKAFVGFTLFGLIGAGVLSLDDPVSRWLGRRWSKASPAQEDRILLRHLSTMTSGLYDDFSVEASPGTTWYYNNNAYHQLRKVIEVATGDTTEQVFERMVARPLGLGPAHWQTRPTMTDPHGWPLAGIHASARDVARLGLCVLSRGRWGPSVLLDPDRLVEMLSPSQHLNPSYGHLWWLPTQPRAILPGGTKTDPRKAFGGRRLNHPIIPNAPTDLVAGFGAGNQRLYVSRALGVVVVRLGPVTAQPQNDSFDQELWRRLVDASTPGTSSGRG